MPLPDYKPETFAMPFAPTGHEQALVFGEAPLFKGHQGGIVGNRQVREPF